MRVFPSAPPSTEVETMNMISTTDHSSKGKEVVETYSLGPHEVLYDSIQSISKV